MEAFDARLTQELEHVTCESDAKQDKSHEHLPEMQESVETRIRDELLRIEPEHGAKDREAETKAAAATAVAPNTEQRPTQHSRARVLTVSPKSTVCEKLLLCWRKA